MMRSNISRIVKKRLPTPFILLKRELAHLSSADITVVEFDATIPDIAMNAHPVGRRYRTLFGDGIVWSARGLDGWLATGAR